MKSFKSLISEAYPWINNTLDRDFSYDPKKKPNKLVLDRRQTGLYLPGKMGEYHKILRVHDTPATMGYYGKEVSYYLHNPQTDNMEIEVHGEEVGKNKLFIHGLSSSDANNFKAHEFYHHLITKHGLHLHSDLEQSVGGMKVWQKLSQMPDIHIQAYNERTNKYEEIKPNFHKRYDKRDYVRISAKRRKKSLTEAYPWINPELDVDDINHPTEGKGKPRAPDLNTSERGKYLPGGMGEHHKVIKVVGRHWESDNTTGISYYLHNLKTNNVEMAVHGAEDGKGRFLISGLGAYAGGKYKAHEFYHHLITKHDMHLHSDFEQSTGGMKVWKALHKMPGIHMQSYNMSTEKYSELKPNFQREYDHDSSTRLAARKK